MRKELIKFLKGNSSALYIDFLDNEIYSVTIRVRNGKTNYHSLYMFRNLSEKEIKIIKGWLLRMKIEGKGRFKISHWYWYQKNKNYLDNLLEKVSQSLSIIEIKWN